MKTTRPSYPMATLYVGDLHPDITEAMLFDKFSRAGPVLSIRVCRDMVTRRSLGYAYVNFQQPADAERALDTMNFDTVKGRPIRMMWSQRDPSLRKSGVGNIFIKNLDKSIDNKALYDTFSAFGNILSCKIAADENGSKGYGFIHFETEDSAMNAIQKVDGMLLNGKKVFVGRFMSKKERLEKLSNRVKKFTNIYVKNFGDELDDAGILKLFEPLGKVVSAKVMYANDRKSRGFGFVSYEDPIAAENAVEKLNGKDLNGRLLFVGRAQKKADRQSELKGKFGRRKTNSANRDHGPNLHTKNFEDATDRKMLGAGYCPPKTSTGCQQGFYLTTQIPPMQTDPRWHTQVYPAIQPSTSFRMQTRLDVGQPGSRSAGKVARLSRAPRIWVPRSQPYGHRSCKLTQNKRNPPVAQALEQVFPKPVVLIQAHNEALNIQLSSGSPQEQIQMLGERLFPFIQAMHPEQAGKITGMLLEMEKAELMLMLESSESFRTKVEEAVAVLQAHRANQVASVAQEVTMASTVTCALGVVIGQNRGWSYSGVGHSAQNAIAVNLTQNLAVC